MILRSHEFSEIMPVIYVNPNMVLSDEGNMARGCKIYYSFMGINQVDLVFIIFEV